MTLDELRTSIKSNLDDKLGTLFTPDQLRLKINAAMRFIWNELNRRGKYFSTATETVSFTTDNQEITITGDIHTLIWVKDSNEVPVEVTSESQARQGDLRTVYITRTITVTGANRDRVTKLGYYRVPKIAFDYVIKFNQQITVFDASANGSEIYQEIPLEHHNVIVLYATILSLPKYHEDSKEWKAIYAVEFDNLLDVYESENVNDLHVVDVSNE